MHADRVGELELLEVQPELNLYDAEWPIWTYQEQAPPAKFVFDQEHQRGMALCSMVAGGCIVADSRAWLLRDGALHPLSQDHVLDVVSVLDSRVTRAVGLDEHILVDFEQGELHSGDTASRDRLLDMVQGREAHLFDRAVDNQVSRLRRKVEADSRNPTLIQTVWGGGYMLAADVRREPARRE